MSNNTSPNPPPVIYSPEYQALLKRLAAAEAVCEEVLKIKRRYTILRECIPIDLADAIDLARTWKETRDGQ